jgi:hypothetical protein
MFTCFFPLFLSVDPDVDVAPEADAAPEYDYVPDDTTDDLALAPEQTGKHPHFEHAYIAYSLLSYACIRTATASVFLYLLHSLFIVTCLATLLVILDSIE